MESKNEQSKQCGIPCRGEHHISQAGRQEQQRSQREHLSVCLVHACVLSHFMSDFLLFYGQQPARLLCPWGFSRQEYWSGFPCPPPRDLPDPGIELESHISCTGRQVLYDQHHLGSPICLEVRVLGRQEWLEESAEPRIGKVLSTIYGILTLTFQGF